MSQIWCAQNVRRSRMMKWAIIVFVAMTIYLLVHIMSTRQVVDMETKLPLADVFVIFTFDGEVGTLETHQSCYRVDVEKTDTKGNFVLPAWRRSVNPFLSDARISTWFYKAGYHSLDNAPGRGEPYLLVPDTRPWKSDKPSGFVVPAIASRPKSTSSGRPINVNPTPIIGQPPSEPSVEGRDHEVQDLISVITQCGGVAARRSKDIERVFVAMYEEVRSRNPVDWGFISNLLYEIEKVEHRGEISDSGQELGGAASDHYDERSQQLQRRSANIGKGELWDLHKIRGDK